MDTLLGRCQFKSLRWLGYKLTLQLKSHPLNFLDEEIPNNLKLKVIHTFVQKRVWKMIFSFLCKNLRNSPPLKLCSAQHFHPGGTWNGVKLCHWRWLDAVTRAEEGPLSYSVVVGGWTSLGPTTTTNQTPHPSIPFDKQPRTQSWELHIVGKWVAIFPAGSKRNRKFFKGGSEIGFFWGAWIACRESRRCLSVGAAVLFGLGRSMEWRSANTLIGREHNMKQCK